MLAPVAAALTVLLAGCTVGPDYKGAPATTNASSFKRAPDGVVATAPGVAAWWVALNDPQLTGLIEAGIDNSPDLRAAQARVRQARAGLTQQQSNALPKVGASAAYVRTREPDLSSLSGGSSGSSGRGPVALYLAGFDASWELDLFGGTRRAVEAASAEADVS